MRDSLLNFRCPPWLFQAIREQAARAGLTVSAFVRNAIIEQLKKT